MENFQEWEKSYQESKKYLYADYKGDRWEADNFFISMLEQFLGNLSWDEETERKMRKYSRKLSSDLTAYKACMSRNRMIFSDMSNELQRLTKEIAEDPEERKNLAVHKELLERLKEEREERLQKMKAKAEEKRAGLEQAAQQEQQKVAEKFAAERARVVKARRDNLNLELDKRRRQHAEEIDRRITIQKETKEHAQKWYKYEIEYLYGKELFPAHIYFDTYGYGDGTVRLEEKRIFEEHHMTEDRKKFYDSVKPGMEEREDLGKKVMGHREELIKLCGDLRFLEGDAELRKKHDELLSTLLTEVADLLKAYQEAPQYRLVKQYYAYVRELQVGLLLHEEGTKAFYSMIDKWQAKEAKA